MSHTFVSHISLITTRSVTGTLLCHMSASFTWTWWRVAECYSGFTVSLLDHMLTSLYKKSGTGCYSGFNLTLLCHISASFYKKSGTGQVTVSLVHSDCLPGWVILFLLSQFCVFSIFRLSLPEEWQGVRDEELSTKSGIPGCIFVHASGFIGGNKTYEGALTMAQTALKQSGKNEV